MNSVSTLAATSTVAVAGIGWCFSCENRKSNKRKLHAHDRDHHFSYLRAWSRFDDDEKAQSTPPPTLGHEITDPPSYTSPSPRLSPVPTAGGGSSRRLQRRRPRVNSWNQGLTQFDFESDPLPTRPREVDSRASLSSKRSWMNRLSSYSPLSTPGQHSPSISVSNGSAAPILPSGPASVALPPNKLVKRSPSQNISRAISSSQGISSSSRLVRPTLRRPATSHQRSATLQQQFLMDEARLAQVDLAKDPSRRASGFDISEFDTSSPPEAGARQHFFKPRRIRVRKGNTFSVPNSTQEKVEKFVIRTIVPGGNDRVPYLTLPDSVEPTSSDEEASGSANWLPDDTFVFRGRRDAATPPQAIEEVPTPQSSPLTKQPRRSFSIGDIMSSASPSRVKRKASQNGEGRAENVRRRASAPFRNLPGEVSSPPSSRSTSPPPHPLSSHPPLLSEVLQTSSPPSSQTIAHGKEFPLNTPPDSHSHIHSDPTTMFTSNGGIVSKPGRASSFSSMAGSDNDPRGMNHEDEDIMSEVVYDSLRTDATNSSLDTRGPRADRIFDDMHSNSETEQASMQAIQGLTLSDTPPSSASVTRQSNHDDVESISTPIRVNVAADVHDSSSKSQRRQSISTTEDWASAHSQADVGSPRKSKWTKEFADAANDDDEDDYEWNASDEQQQHEPKTPLSSPKSRRLLEGQAEAVDTTSVERKRSKKMARNSLFDWAEQSQHDRDESGKFRPQTVHGKRTNGPRGGRSDGRRGPSALHVRSQSVPVVPDVDGNREHAANKFGTWGLGSKNVSEDWDNDFDFDPGHGHPTQTIGDGADERAATTPTEMVVPKAIKESQANVIGNLGHIREFALMVENLKRLRAQAADLGILDGDTAALWREAEAMIDLATVDNDEPEVLVSTKSTSAGNPDAFDDDWTAPSSSPPDPQRGRRKSVLGFDDDVFGGPVESSLQQSDRKAAAESQVPNVTSSPQSRRKQSNVDTATIAKTVIETMQHRRKISNTPAPRKAVGKAKSDKLSFDTTTLKDLVAYVNSLTRKLSQVIREVDGASLDGEEVPYHSAGGPIMQLFVDPNAT